MSELDIFNDVGTLSAELPHPIGEGKTLFKVYMGVVWVLSYIAAVTHLSTTAFLIVNGFVMAFVGFYAWDTVQHEQ